MAAKNEGSGKPRAPHNGSTEPGDLGGRPDPTEGGQLGQFGAQAREPGTTPSGTEPPAGWGRFLVAPRPLGLLPSGVPPIEFQALLSLLEEDAEVRVLRQVRPFRIRGLGAIAEPHPVCPLIAVVAMSPERARSLTTNPQVVVEADQALIYPAANPVTADASATDPALAVPLTQPAAMRVRVQASDKTPVADAHVWAIGSTGPTHAITDAAGTATLVLSADIPQTVRALYVRPTSGYWPARLQGAALPQDGQTETVIQVRALVEDFEGFPARAMTGWGPQAMRVTQLPPTFRGHGTSIALIDSGVTGAHPDLKDTVAGGHDFTNGNDRTWDQDATGHGTWCAGVIAAADNRTGISGIAADAALHALKLYPGGRISHLLEALDWCITHDIDLVQINLATAQPSQLVAWKTLDVRGAGTTCIAPAGNTSGATAFPAALPTVVSVGALAHTGATPTAPRAEQATWPGPYIPSFSPAGVDLVAPGTAVITTSTDGDYTPADGTAVAAAHVTALAALLIAHHDQLRTPLLPRTHVRVDLVTGLLRAGCHQLPTIDPVRSGAGLPDAPTALGLTTSSWPASPHFPGAAQPDFQYAPPRS